MVSKLLISQLNNTPTQMKKMNEIAYLVAEKQIKVSESYEISSGAILVNLIASWNISIIMVN